MFRCGKCQKKKNRNRRTEAKTIELATQKGNLATIKCQRELFRGGGSMGDAIKLDSMPVTQRPKARLG